MELSVSELAARCQTTVARVNWALLSRGIRPSRLVGNTRLYGPSEVAALEVALRETGSRSGGRKRSRFPATAEARG